ncbi:MAG: hypothetical protein MZU91_12250 [Desulfosudis oleivorans]|nr:hypothetical protein [Desulfosudis oleivorans]
MRGRAAMISTRPNAASVANKPTDGGVDLAPSSTPAPRPRLGASGGETSYVRSPPPETAGAEAAPGNESAFTKPSPSKANQVIDIEAASTTSCNGIEESSGPQSLCSRQRQSSRAKPPSKSNAVSTTPATLDFSVNEQPFAADRIASVTPVRTTTRETPTQPDRHRIGTFARAL